MPETRIETEPAASRGVCVWCVFAELGDLDAILAAATARAGRAPTPRRLTAASWCGLPGCAGGLPPPAGALSAAPARP